MAENCAEDIGLVEDRFQNSNSNQEYTEVDEIEIVRMKNLISKKLGQTVIDVICIIITLGALKFVHTYFDPVIKGFYCDNTDIFNPHLDDKVPFMVVVLYGTVVPLIFIILIELNNSNIFKCLRKKITIPSSSRKQFLVSISHAISLFILGLSLTLLVTDVGKRVVGRLRPHFISACKPNFNNVNCTTTYGSNTIYNYIDTSGTFCTNSEESVKEARLSFPSGHSSFATYCMLFLILYIQIRWYLTQMRFLKVLIQISAFLAAYFTCLSRISDFHHRGNNNRKCSKKCSKK
jgi:phosphatidate phosphatase